MKTLLIAMLLALPVYADGVNGGGSGSISTTGAGYFASGSQSIPNNAFTVVNFDTKIWDTDSAVTAGASWHFVAPATGKYRLSGTVLFTGAATINILILSAFKGGAEFARIYESTPGTTLFLGPNNTAAGSIDMLLTIGDSIDFRVLQNSGGAYSTNGSGNGFVNCSIYRLPGI